MVTHAVISCLRLLANSEQPMEVCDAEDGTLSRIAGFGEHGLGW